MTPHNQIGGILKAPFPWFGGKSRVAPQVWAAFGNVLNYVEPFFGSGAVLLGRPHRPNTETVNDLDGYVANFWRAVQAEPDAVAYWADQPVYENNLHAVHNWLVARGVDLVERLEGDPDYCDARIAGCWVWGISCWIGGGFCSGVGPWVVEDGRLVKRDVDGAGNGGVTRKLPHLGDRGKGVNRQLPHLGDRGKGVNRQLPHLGNRGQGVNRQRPDLNMGRGVNRSGYPRTGERGERLYPYMSALSDRLAGVRVTCGDWSRVLGFSPTVSVGLTGVFLDPPYAQNMRDEGIYRTDADGLSAEVRKWAIAHGDDPMLRIALCGYEEEHTMPESWQVLAHKAGSGYGRGERGVSNRDLERIWLSPHCLGVSQQLDMFGV